MKATKIVLLLAFIVIHDIQRVKCRDFTYNGLYGPEHWREQYNGCGGKHQSPININILEVAVKPFPPLNMTYFDDVPVSGELLNNGHTVVVKLVFEKEVPSIADGPLAARNTFLLSQFHFHWGENNTVGSEDRINNVSFPAELHMVFRNAKYADFDEAATKMDGVAVMAFFYALQEDDNPKYAEFTDLLREVPNPHMHVPFRNPPKMKDLISIDTENYFTYTGSLTTPPCSENVEWIDFATPIMISTEQIERFRRLYTYDGTPLTHNFRPIQPLNNRTVYKSMPLVQSMVPLFLPSSSANSVKWFDVILILNFLIIMIFSQN